MDINNAKNIYCLGIGGIGVSALARVLKSKGKAVSGSDFRESIITKSLQEIGIKVYIGHKTENLSSRPDLVIYSLDVSSNSPGFVEMEEIDMMGITKLTQSEALAQLMDAKYGIAVTGTNGKSTTTAILGLIADTANSDPTVILGSMLSPKNESEKFRGNARRGEGKYFIAESDEYRRKMMDNHPKMIVLTNVAEDHLDYYKDLDEIKSAFVEYAHSLPADGMLIYNADDHNSVVVGREATCHKFTFGIHHYADLQAINLIIKNGVQMFDLHLNDSKIGEIELQVPGIFNVSNALAAILAALKLGIDFESIKKSVESYVGIWRRFEKVGEVSGKTVVSDYAHHPDAISGTIQAAKEFFPGKKVLVVFQPHHRNRTKSLMGEFIDSLMDADEVIVTEIFDVEGREHGEEVSSQQIVDELVSKGEEASFTSNLSETEALVMQKLQMFDVCLFLGAGDIDSLARKIVN